MSSTIYPPRESTSDADDRPLPPLINGDHLSRVEFERRYNAQPQIKKAELIEGIVYMPSPVHLEKHSKPHSRIVMLLGNYAAATPGVDFGDNVTLRLDRENEVQPDAFLRIKEEHGGQSRAGADDYLEGPPELIVEVAASSAAYDLYEKLRVYRRNGVQEYLVLLAHEKETRFFHLVADVYEPSVPDQNGLYRSKTFPGLVLHADKFWADDLAGLLDALAAGLDDVEHEAFVDKLTARL